MVTSIHDLVKIPDNAIKMIVAGLETDELITFLMEAPSEVKEKIYANLTKEHFGILYKRLNLTHYPSMEEFQHAFKHIVAKANELEAVGY